MAVPPEGAATVRQSPIDRRGTFNAWARIPGRRFTPGPRAAIAEVGHVLAAATPKR